MKVTEKVWEALVQSQVRFNMVPEDGSGEGFCGRIARSGSSGCCRRLRNMLEHFAANPSKVQLGSFLTEPGQVQHHFGEMSGEGLGGFGAETGQVQQGSGKGS